MEFTPTAKLRAWTEGLRRGARSMEAGGWTCSRAIEGIRDEADGAGEPYRDELADLQGTLDELRATIGGVARRVDELHDDVCRRYASERGLEPPPLLDPPAGDRPA